MEPNNDPLLKIPQFRIDHEGIFKYIRVDCVDESKQITYYVRGSPLEYHKQIFDAFLNEIQAAGIKTTQVKRDNQSTLQSFKVVLGNRLLTFKCPGGGRMVHSAKNKSLEIYGYSITYSKGNKIKHDITMEIARKYLDYPKGNIFISKKTY